METLLYGFFVVSFYLFLIDHRQAANKTHCANRERRKMRHSDDGLANYLKLVKMSICCNYNIILIMFSYD